MLRSLRIAVVVGTRMSSSRSSPFEETSKPLPRNALSSASSSIAVCQSLKLVITSYSIHYTKLYDNAPVPQPQETPEGPPEFGLPHAIKVSDDGIVYLADSYNFV